MEHGSVEPKSRESGHAAGNAHKWDERARNFDARRFDYFRWMQRRALRLLEIKPGMRFLDLGCGTGYAVRHVAALVEDEGIFCGIDISPRMIEIARASSGGLQNARFLVADAEELPLDAGFFDAAICTNSFHHYLHPVAALGEVRRVLRPGGRLCVLDITADSRLVRWIDGRVRLREPEHVKFYSTAEYERMFAEAGLKYVASRTVSTPMKAHIAEK
jgi:ubiquinone/menaquinone biosynthesis C-methylase UbiE